MPEIITKYPEIVIKILQDEGATCGKGQAKILTTCPKEYFCSLKSGEFCVYPLANIASMTQISATEIAEVTSGVPSIFSTWNMIILAVVCLFGIYFGMKLR